MMKHNTAKEVTGRSNLAQSVNSMMCQSDKIVEVNDSNRILEVEGSSRSDIIKCTFCTNTLTESGQKLNSGLADDVCHLLCLNSTEWSKPLLYSTLCLTCYKLITETRKLRKLQKYIENQMSKISIQMQRAIWYSSINTVSTGACNDNLSETVDWSPDILKAHLSIVLNLAENRENGTVLLATSGSTNRTPHVDDLVEENNESNEEEDPANHSELETDGVMWLQSNEKLDMHEDIVPYNGSQLPLMEQQVLLVPPPTPTVAKPRKQTHTVRVEDFQMEEDITFQSTSQSQPNTPNLSMWNASGGGSGSLVENGSNLLSTLTGIVVFTPNGNWLLKKPKLQLERIDSVLAKLTLKKKKVLYKQKMMSQSAKAKLSRLEKLKERQKVELKKSKLTAQSSISEVQNEQLPDHESTNISHDDHFPVSTQFVMEFGRLKRIRRTKNGVPIKRYLCPVNSSCTTDPVMTIIEVERHIRSSHGGEFKFFCNVSNCSRGFYTKHGLTDHTSKKHNDDARRFLCEYCPLRYVTSASLTAHYKSAHLNHKSTFTCDICKKTFKHKRALVGHQAKMHTELENPKIEELKCSECDFISTTTKYLQIHMSKKHPEAVKATGGVTRLNYVCTAPNCNYATDCASSLNNHVKGTHIKDKALKCDLCPKSYSYNTALRRHKRKEHEKIRVQCPHCPYSATCHFGLQQHIQIIHDPKPAEQCEVCGETFPIKVYLNRHKLICAQGYRGTGKKTTAAFIEARRRRERNRYKS